MFKVLVTGKISEIGLEILKKEKDIETDYRPDYPYQEVLKIISNYDCILFQKSLVASNKKSFPFSTFFLNTL